MQFGSNCWNRTISLEIVNNIIATIKQQNLVYLTIYKLSLYLIYILFALIILQNILLFLLLYLIYALNIVRLLYTIYILMLI